MITESKILNLLKKRLIGAQKQVKYLKKLIAYSEKKIKEEEEEAMKEKIKKNNNNKKV